MVSLGSTWSVDAVTSCKHLHINQGPQEGEVIITREKRTVLIYSIENREPSNSWTCKPNELFTRGVIYNLLSKQFVAIVNLKILRKWTVHQSNLEDGEKIVFLSDIHCILSSLNNEPVVIFENGTVESLQAACKHPKDNRKKHFKEEETIYATDVNYKSDGLEVAIITFNKIKQSYNFVNVFLHSDGVEKTRLTRPLSEITNLECFCFFKKDRFSLAVLSTLKKQTNLCPETSLLLYELVNDEIQRVINNLSNNLNHILDQEGCQSILATDLGDGHLGIMAIHDEETVISIWNVQFGVERVSKIIPGRYDPVIWNHSKCFLLISSDKLIVLPYSTEIPTLSTVIGSKISSQSCSDVDNKQWINFKEISLPSGIMKDHFSQHLLPIFGKLKKELSATIICRETFTFLISKRDTQAICTALRFFTEIPEDVLVLLLIYLFGFQIDKEGKITERPLKNSTKNSSYINMVLNLPFSDLILQDEIRNLPLDFVKILLSYLLKEYGNEHVEGSTEVLLPGKITDWLCAIFDAQLYNLILMKDEEILQILIELSAQIKLQFSYLEEMEKLERAINHMKLKSPSIDRRAYPYCIQILKV